MRFERDDARVGLLVLLAAGLFAFLAIYRGALLLGKGDVRHLVRFTEAGGIEVGTEVRLQGFRVGQVEEIELRREGTAYSFVATLALHPDVVLWRGTKGVVVSGIMGGADLELRLPPPAERQVALRPGEAMDGETSASVGSLVAELTELARNANRGVSEVREELRANGLSSVFGHPNVRRALADLSAAFAAVRGASETSRGTMAHGDVTLRALDRVLARLEVSLTVLQGVMERRGPDLDAAAARLAPTLDRVGALADEAKSMVDTLGPQAGEGLDALRRTLDSTQELVEILKAKPNRLVFGTPSEEEKSEAKRRVEASKPLPPATAGSGAKPPAASAAPAP